jgi:hypothetical protein
MDKVKVDFSKYNAPKEKEIYVGENTIHVKEWITVAEKLELLDMLAMFMLETDEPRKMRYRSAVYELGRRFLIIKYYTDVDTDGATPTDVVDWISGSGHWDDIINWCLDDMFIVDEMVDTYVQNEIDAYNREQSLSTAIRNSFGFLLNGEDITETMAKAGETGDQILEVVDRLNKAAKKPEAGKVNIGGNVISIGKKNT